MISGFLVSPIRVLVESKTRLLPIGVIEPGAEEMDPEVTWPVLPNLNVGRGDLQLFSIIGDIDRGVPSESFVTLELNSFFEEEILPISLKVSEGSAKVSLILVVIDDISGCTLAMSTSLLGLFRADGVSVMMVFERLLAEFGGSEVTGY